MKNTMDNFWDRVDKSTDCWHWTGSKTSKGYGQFKLNGKNRLVHRVSYETLKGTIPDGLVVDHLCRNRGCVNPSHMDIVTSGENVLRGVGPTAQFARATHCIHGHPFDKNNTFIYKRSTTTERVCITRVCITCNRQSTRERRARLKLSSGRFI